MKFLQLLCFLGITFHAFAGKVSGFVSDSKGNALPFSSIIVKGTLQGTTANALGVYSIPLSEGEHTLVVQYIGFKTIEKKIIVGRDDEVMNFELTEQQYQLANVVVKKGEDPAYAIIRNAIKTRKEHETELKKYETEVYVKGQLRTRNYPKKFLGKDVDFEDGDTSKRKMVFLYETLAKFSVEEPKRKIEVISTKVSGDKDAFGFGSAQIFSFYQNNISIGDLNPRGFISPISNNALNYYRYKFEGTFFENNEMISRIKVTPKRKYEPLFNGYINIIENEWRIQSVQLTLYRENQMQLVDTLKIEQLYVPFKNSWIIKQQTLSPAIKLFGFDMTGQFVQVFDKWNFNPVFTKGFFTSTYMKYEDSSNKRSTNYWDSIRPVPLMVDEVKDYNKKDSLEQVRKQPRYLDSLDKKRNKLSSFALIFTGQTFTRQKTKTTVQLGPLLDNINFNTVEGAVVDFAPVYQKRFSDTWRNTLSITPNFRYGFSNNHFNASIRARYQYGKKYTSSITISGGKNVFQFDPNNPISPQYNTISTLEYEQNYLKIYEAAFGKLGYSKELAAGLTAAIDLQYQDRRQLDNTTTTKWRDFENRDFTPNFALPANKAVIATVHLKWQPGTKYIEFPSQVVNMGSTYPTFSVSYTQGIKRPFGSDVDYSKWKFSINDDINFKRFGAFEYNLSIGGFLNQTSVFLPDDTHFRGNQLSVINQDLETYQLMPYYSFSNHEHFYSATHFIYHLNGLLTNKVPVLKKLNCFLVTGGNLLYLTSGKSYSEFFIGLENILKVIRIDFVKSITNAVNGTTGVRVSLPILNAGGTTTSER